MASGRPVSPSQHDAHVGHARPFGSFRTVSQNLASSPVVGPAQRPSTRLAPSQSTPIARQPGRLATTLSLILITSAPIKITRVDTVQRPALAIGDLLHHSVGDPAQSAGDLPVICLAEPRAPGRWLLGRDAVTSKFGGKLAVIEYGSLPGVTQAPGHAGQDPEGGFPNGGWAGSFMAGHWRCNSRLFPHGRRVPAGRRTCEYLRCVLAAHWPAVIGETDRIALALEPPAQGRGVHDPLRCHLAPEPAAPPRCPLKTKAVNVLPAC